jgi:hypothetical protein
MLIIHEWKTREGFDGKMLRTVLPGMHIKVDVPANKLEHRDELEKRLGASLVAIVYPPKQMDLEPVLQGILHLLRQELVKSPVGYRLLVKMLDDVRAIAYALPPVEFKREE